MTVKTILKIQNTCRTLLFFAIKKFAAFFKVLYNNLNQKSTKNDIYNIEEIILEGEGKMIGDSIASVAMQRALDGAWERQKAISNNIANFETPGYKALKVSFEQSLALEIRKNQTFALNSGENNIDFNSLRNSDINVFKDSNSSERADGNNVNLENENIDMAKTQLQYQYLTRGMSDMFARLRYAVSEGKK